MSNAITVTSVLLLALVLWIIYYMTFLDRPDQGVTTILVGGSVLIVVFVKWIIGRLRSGEKNK